MISAQIDRVRRVVVGRENYTTIYLPLARAGIGNGYQPKDGELAYAAADMFRDDLLFLAATYFEQERQSQLQRERRGDV